MEVALEPRLAAAVIPPTLITGVVEIGEREGVLVGRWFSGTGLDPAVLVTSADVRISFRQASTVLKRAIRAMPGRPLGMRVGGRDVLLSFGMLGLAMRSCSTLVEALGLALEYHESTGSLLDVAVERYGDEVAVRLDERWPDPELIAFLCEEGVCSSVVLIRSLLGGDWAPRCVELTYPEPTYAADYHRFFRCPVRFNADANRLMLSAADLVKPLFTHHEPTRAAAIEACRRLLEIEGSARDVTAAVEALLNRNLRRPPTMAQVAERLSITERTLRRQLSESGEQFSTLRDRLRERRATFLLSESTLTVNAVALEVGFSDAREFRRAYVRWTGFAPSVVRRRKRGSA